MTSYRTESAKMARSDRTGVKFANARFTPKITAFKMGVKSANARFTPIFGVDIRGTFS